MTVELDREGLEILVKGSEPSFEEFDNPLVVKAGMRYSDQYGTIKWLSLKNITDDELYQLYLICRNSW